MFDCEKCWSTPCGCGWDFYTQSPKEIKELIAILESILAAKKARKTREQWYDDTNPPETK
jgi:hypothetical protein